MGNEEHVALIKQGVDAWNAWRRENPDVRPDLTGANLSRANLYEAGLYEANLRRADLRADLRGADLRMAILTGANLSRSGLVGANLTRANLRRADLTGAYLFQTVFGDVNLSVCKGLDQCEHHGPSIIDHQTLQKSGPLPLVFLRGVGLTDNLIESLWVHSPPLAA
jgi:Pentapeptide repeats (8 copies)